VYSLRVSHPPQTQPMKNWVCAWINRSIAHTIGDYHSHVVCDTGTKVLEDPDSSHQPAKEITVPNYVMLYTRWSLASRLNIFKPETEQHIKHAIYLHNC
jgi:hypothetical protein